MATSIFFFSSLFLSLLILMKVQGKTLIHQTGPSVARLVCHRQNSNPGVCMSPALLFWTVQPCPLLYLSDIKTYDALARMENMDTVKQLAVPKSSRLLGRSGPLIW